MKGERLFVKRQTELLGKPFPRDYRRPPDAEERLKTSLHHVRE